MTTRETRSTLAARIPAAALPSIRRESLAMSVLLLVQYGLGCAMLAGLPGLAAGVVFGYLVPARPGPDLPRRR